MTLNQLYSYINDALKGTFIINEMVDIQARVKLKDGSIHTLKVVGVSKDIRDIPEEERNKMAGMYPLTLNTPTKRAQISIDCELNNVNP